MDLCYLHLFSMFFYNHATYFPHCFTFFRFLMFSYRLFTFDCFQNDLTHISYGDLKKMKVLNNHLYIYKTMFIFSLIILFQYHYLQCCTYSCFWHQMFQQFITSTIFSPSLSPFSHLPPRLLLMAS